MNNTFFASLSNRNLELHLKALQDKLADAILNSDFDTFAKVAKLVGEAHKEKREREG